MLQLENTTLIGTSELRTLGPKAWKALKNTQIVLTKRGKPIAIVEDYAEYQEREKILSEFEDTVLGHLAQKRLQDGAKMLSSEEMEMALFSHN